MSSKRDQIDEGEADGTGDNSVLEIPPTDDEEDVVPFGMARKSARLRNFLGSSDSEDVAPIESDSEDSEEEVVQLRKSMYAAYQESDEEPIENQAYSKSTRRSIHGFVPNKSVVANSDESSDDSDVIEEEDEEGEGDNDQPVSYIQDEEAAKPEELDQSREDSQHEESIQSREPSVYLAHMDNSLEILKVRVSPGIYKAEQKAIEALKRKIKALQQEVRDKQRILATWEVDENLSVDESFEEAPDNQYVPPPNMPTTRRQALLGVDVRDVQPNRRGKRGMRQFREQKEAMVDKLKKLLKEIDARPNEADLEEAPKYLKVELMKHQLHAVKFMLWREASSPRGGLLADDMGLGKTLTTISLIMKSIQRTKEGVESDNEYSSDEENDGRKGLRKGGTLVVCPASLIKQWEAEIKSKTYKGALDSYMFHGQFRESNAKTLAKYDVVLTTYRLISDDLRGGKKGCLFKIKWKRIILDEGHVIRNYKSQQSMAVCKLSAKYRWVMTGTPIHNKEFDMFAAIKFLRCSPFDDVNYWQKWILKTGASSTRLQILLQAILLRRTKEQLIGTGEIQSLPDKTLTVVSVDLSSEERQVYAKFQALSQSIFANYAKQKQARCEPEGLSHEKIARMFKKFAPQLVIKHRIKNQEILTLLLRLRQCCCHPGLVKEAFENIDIMKEKLAGDDSMIDHSTEDIMNTLKHLNIENSEVFSLDYPSSKVKKLIEVLKEKIVDSGDKAIVVSQWPSFLDIIRGMLEVEDIACCELIGSTQVHHRNDIVVNFNKNNSPQKVMLLSLTAGGVGLHLVGANYLFFMDVHWNPQLEQQAQDRIYRLGQKKPVNIFKFICNNTVEDQIIQKQEEVLKVVRSALTGANEAAESKLMMVDLHKMFGMDDV